MWIYDHPGNNPAQCHESVSFVPQAICLGPLSNVIKIKLKRSIGRVKKSLCSNSYSIS